MKKCRVDVQTKLEPMASNDKLNLDSNCKLVLEKVQIAMIGSLLQLTVSGPSIMFGVGLYRIPVSPQ